jgi:DNA-binding winged helix-turn-helix (wHTH) protein/TolB-like protein/Tfp pilus assembly protein PilF
MSSVSAGQARSYEFGGFRIDPSERQLYRGGVAVALPPKAIDLLRVLLEEPGRLRSRDELLRLVWPDVIVDESNLSQNIFVLRKALDDEGEGCIVTVPRRGYRFAAAVRITGQSAGVELVPPTPVDPPRLRTRRLGWTVAAASLVAALLAIASLLWVRHSRSAAQGSIRSIAVLPFRTIDERHPDRPMELGIADTLINKLSQLPQLVVSPTRAVSRYVEHPLDALAAGRELNVDAVLEGNLQRDHNRLRCTVRLLRVSNGAAVWADEYDEDLGDLFTLEDRIAERAALALDLKLSNREKSDLGKRYTRDRGAWELYERGRLEWGSFDPKRLLASIRYFQAALQKDPNYALAYTGLANAYSVIGIYGPLPADESFARAREAALRAVELDPDLGQAHSALAGSEIFRGWHWDVAESELKRALELDPNFPDAHSLRSYVLQARGRAAESVAETRRAHDLDPTWQIAQNDEAVSLFSARRYDECARLGREILKVQPENRLVPFMLASTMVAKGDLDAAQAMLLRNEQAHPDDVRTLSLLGVIEARKGQRAAALRRIAKIESLRASNPTRRVFYYLAWIHAALGDRDRAFAALDESFRERYPFLWRVRTDAEDDTLRDDRRMALLLEKMNL